MERTAQDVGEMLLLRSEERVHRGRSGERVQDLRRRQVLEVNDQGQVGHGGRERKRTWRQRDGPPGPSTDQLMRGRTLLPLGNTRFLTNGWSRKAILVRWSSENIFIMWPSTVYVRALSSAHRKALSTSP